MQPGHEHYIVLITTMVGVIQGLAFSHLAEKLPDLDETMPLHMKALFVTNFFFCLLVVARVFQTYISAALDEKQYPAFGTVDLLSAFLVGILQYWIFDAVSKREAAPRKMYWRTIPLALAACALHARTAHDLPTYDNLVTQASNIFFSFLVFVACCVGLRTRSTARQAFVSATMCLALFCAITISLARTELGAPQAAPAEAPPGRG